MASHDPLAEFRADWLPHVTDDGLAGSSTCSARPARS